MGVRAPSLKRSLGLAAVGSSLAFAVALSACGDDGGTTQPSIIIQPSTFSTIVSTTAPAAAAQAGGSPGWGDGRRHAGLRGAERRLPVRAIANDYGIPPESIANFNQWDDGLDHVHPSRRRDQHPARSAGAGHRRRRGRTRTPTPTTRAPSTEADERRRSTPTTRPRCADGSRQGTYTIEAGDIPAQVAESLDVTVDQLNEANANTPGYSAFIVGADILVPCGDERSRTEALTWRPRLPPHDRCARSAEIRPAALRRVAPAGDAALAAVGEVPLPAPPGVRGPGRATGSLLRPPGVAPTRSRSSTRRRARRRRARCAR